MNQNGKNSLISVIIPAYDEEKLIGRCLESLSHQTFPRNKYEIIVVNNNSNDKTAEIALSWGARVVDYTEKRGYSVSLQYGVSQSVAPLVAFIDADSVASKNWLENISKIMQDETLQCVGGTILSTEHSPFVDFQFSFFNYIAQLTQKLFRISLVWGANSCIRRSAFEAVHGYNLNLKTGDDWDLVARIQRKFGKKSTYYTPQLLVYTSPRRQKSLSLMIPYIYIGMANFVALYIFKKSQTYGYVKNVR